MAQASGFAFYQTTTQGRGTNPAVAEFPARKPNVRPTTRFQRGSRQGSGQGRVWTQIQDLFQEEMDEDGYFRPIKRGSARG